MEREDANVDRLVVLLAALVIGCGGSTDAIEFASTGEAGDATQEATGGDATGGGESDTGGNEPTGGTTTGGTDTGGSGPDCGELGNTRSCQCGSGRDWRIGVQDCEVDGWGDCYCDEPENGGAAGAAPEASGGVEETGGADTGGTEPATGGTLTGGTGAGGAGTGGATTGGMPATGGEATGGELPTGGTGGAVLCRWSCLSVTRLSGSPDPISATTTIDGVACSTAPSDACTKDATFAIHSVCAVGDRTPEETTDCLPDEILGTGGSGGQGPRGWSCRYFSYDSEGTVTDETTIDGDCGDPCDVVLPLVCDRTQMTGCEDWSCDRSDIECTFDGQAMATDYNGLGLGIECISS